MLNTTKLGKLRDRPMSFEEHTVRKWARLAADTKEGGYGIFDTIMALKPAAGLITSQAYSDIAFTSIKHSCNAVIHSLDDNQAPINITRHNGLFMPGTIDTPYSTASRSVSPASTSSSSTDCILIESDSDSSGIEYTSPSQSYGHFSQP